ncbi:ribosome biogenesis GTPase YqeH [Caldalkalibacillus thermarum TA2.A1]|uniref:Ribosome biogenesis GTPase YqeH n=1 Tax=Caldalkalibacillus thermarum (strain TA2.A1) TaxID=986075 RepID=A0A8X8I9F8_CALTT|nr:ribosome biogenesis GTPase YqeH [Caldalkalibacillus thermarum]QZT33419.1 ribosome biogenesis GTPase YqeH [Caldalkalibacillus thermarum TA2.A1]
MAVFCTGCGVKLQSENPGQPGYVPVSALEREQVICQRCFRIKHYNDLTPVPMDNDEFIHILHRIGEARALVVKIVDLFDFNGSWLPGLMRFVNFNPVVLVVNKTDLFPRVNWVRIEQWVRRQAKEGGLKPVDVVFCSAEKGTGIQALMKSIEQHRQGGDVYVVGATNVGKSTLINQILKQAGAEKAPVLTTSRFPGTTLDMIKIPLDDGQALYDTPGVINDHQMAHYVASEDLKVILPNKPLKPKVYQLNPRQTLFFGGLARLDFASGERQSFVCYMSNELPVHRTKLEKADELYSKHLGGMLSPPGNESLKEWGPLDQHTFSLKDELCDIVFSGLGWVAVKGTGARLTAYAPKGAGVYVRPSMI